ncbi:hypothetical protein [Seonamhaeicola algicola]|uniref:hypothetical protein n=1 Tax=Seonamhaeicola algicola TaxID=1719036 RepID=UPI00164BD904|nr:hypothetical protein [Seonamhaeicola algicola]
MKFLSPEIEALYKYHNKSTQTKSLARQSTSCGIFQDCDYSENRPSVYYHNKQK